MGTKTTLFAITTTTALTALALYAAGLVRQLVRAPDAQCPDHEAAQRRLEFLLPRLRGGSRPSSASTEPATGTSGST